MSDDYLWDRSVPPDPDVERLEQLLGRLRSTPHVPDVSTVRLKPDTTDRSATSVGKGYLGVRVLAPARAWLHAVIAAPPGQFVVDTPSATATDLGCAYTLRVDEDGSGLLSVEQGWVALEANGLESFVPAGASCRIDPARGPGTPRYDDDDAAYR